MAKPNGFWCLVFLMVSRFALGWGEPGHMIINRAAAQLMKSGTAGFFQANADNLAKFSTTPDLKWKQKATYPKEKALHFFQWDVYSGSAIADSFPISLEDALASVGQKFIDANGSAVWRSSQIYELMKSALANGDCKTALQMGGVLGHYIGDMSQPMHTTSDYDGQSIGDPGIHAYFESTLVKKQDQSQLLKDVVTAGRKKHPEVEPDAMDVIEMTLLESEASLAALTELLDDFTADPQDDDDLVAHLPPLMGRGAYVLARVWDLASVGARDCGSKAITVDEPEWFPLYSSSPKQ